MIRSVNQLCRLSVTYNNSSEVKRKDCAKGKGKGEYEIWHKDAFRYGKFKLMSKSLQGGHFGL